MKLIVEGTKKEIKALYKLQSEDCNLPWSCSKCVFSVENTDCLLTDDILQFLKDRADFTVKDDK